MKTKISKFFKKIFQMSRTKKIIIITALIIIAIVAYFMFGRSKSPDSIQTDFATKQNLQETVLSTGQVVSGTDLSLSFQGSGVVRQVYVKEGDKVELGQKLAELDQASAMASLTSARGSLAQAQANYEKLLAGTNIDNINTGAIITKSSEVALNGAYNNALNALNDASVKIYNVLASVTTIQNTYFTGFDQSARDGKTKIKIALDSLSLALDKIKGSSSSSEIDDALSVAVYSLNTTSNSLKVIRDTFDETYYYGRIPDSEKLAIDTYRTTINTVLLSIINNQQAISNAKISFLQSQPEIKLAKGQVLSAEGQVQSAQAIVNNSIVLAPASGVITQIDIKVGEQATPSKQVMILQDIDNLHTEADVSEANIASLQTDQVIDYTFDALGPDKHFTGKVLTINPSSTVISGVVNYKITGSLDNVPEIKPGMTANMTILVAKKDNVLSIPSTAVINKNGKQYVRAIDDPKKKTYHEVQVQTGLQADGGLIEIISGLNDGQEIVTYIKL